MIGRFLTDAEKKYQGKFPKDGVLPYYFESDDNAFEDLLLKALERGTPATKEEVVALYGGGEAYERQRGYLKEWDYPNA